MHATSVGLLSLAAALPCLAPATEDPTYSLEDLVAGNRRMLERIERVDLVLRHVNRNFLGDRPFGEPEENVWRWTRSDRQERLRFRSPGTDDRGRPNDIYDYFSDGTTVKVLRNWDPETPQPITPLDQGSVRAHVRPYEADASGREPTRFLLWSLSVGKSDGRRTLADLVRDSPSTELAGPTDFDGHRVWRIRVVAPGSPVEAVDGAERHSFDVFVDPEIGFAIRGVVEHSLGLRTEIDGKPETYSLVVTRTGKDFEAFGEGVFVPTRIESHGVATTSDRREFRTETGIENATVNRPLPEGALDFAFPRDVLVIDESKPDAARTVWLWGDDDRPVKEIRNPEDVPGFRELQEPGGTLVD